MYPRAIAAKADLILHNAAVMTMDKERPAASLVAISGNTIIGIGNESSLESFRGSRTRLIDCKGRLVLPGFNDAHCHPLALAVTLMYVDCGPAAVSDIAGIKWRIRERAEETPGGRWVRGANYDEAHLMEKRPPSRWDLDEASPHRPVILVHSSGHECVLNSLGLQLLGISRDTPDQDGGIIHRHPGTGEPDGVVSGRNALVEAGVPPLSDDELEQGARLSSRMFISAGITSIQDTTWSNGISHWEKYQRLVQEGLFLPRVCMLAGTGMLDEFHAAGLHMGSGNNRLRLGGMKLALDESTGCSRPDGEEIKSHACRAHEAGFQVAFHAGDAYLLEASLNAIEWIQRIDRGTDRRHRLEHCPVCPPDLVARIAASRALVVTQPSFIYFNGQQYIDEVPSSKHDWLFPIGSLTRLGIGIAFSSDSPMLPCNPLAGIYSAVMRKAKAGAALSPEEGVSLMEALRMYTAAGAYASFEEGIKGSISPGKLADLVMLSSTPAQTTPDEVMHIEVLFTVLDGEVVWQAW